MAVFAKSGAGKSYAVKLGLLLRGLLLGHDAAVVDPEGEYAPLCRALDGQEVRLGVGAPHVLNPFDLAGAGAEERGDPLAEQVATLLALLQVMLADPGKPLGRAEVGALDRAIHATYARAGITPDPATHDRPPPCLADLHAILRAQGEPYGLADRLERYVSGSLRHLFGGPTNVDLQRRLVVFSLRDLEAELRPLATFLVADCVWRRARRERARPRLFVVDEAWSLVRHTEGAAFLAELAKRGRKHRLGLVTITQDVEDFLGSPQGRAVIANASVHLLMKQDPSSIDVVAATFKLTEPERRELLAARRGEGLLCALGTRVPLRVEASPSEHELITTNPAELAAGSTRDGVCA
jgi:type IV secretory pathway VirB4 component